MNRRRIHQSSRVENPVAPDRSRPPRRQAEPFAATPLVSLVLAPWRYVVGLLDEMDESRARGLRSQLGRRRWVVSWYRGHDLLWHARISGPGLVRTMERAARTRTQAVARATAAMTRILALRDRLGAQPDRDPDALLDGSQ